MKKISRPIVFFGTENFSAKSLRALIDADFEIVAVVTKPDSAQGRGKKIQSHPIKEIALAANIPVWQPEKVLEISDNIKSLQSPVGILVSYGNIIPDSILDLFKPGIINIHPSLLPKYRGPSPIESAILNGDSQTGVSIMKLTKEMDAGPIYSQIKIDLKNDEYSEDLYETLAKKGAELLIDILPSILDEQLQATPQDETNTSYCQLIEKSGGIIDWSKPASTIEREIRAFHRWPKSRTKLGEVEVIIAKAHTYDADGSPGKTAIIETNLIVHCGKSSLSIDTIQPLGKKEMPIQAFLAGYKNKLILEE